ncbi:MAG: saccharopine dehydrogenase C-terminal domain-containing protein [Polyangia bacterium]|jgi:saccharopine dehydrogenase-like NADP-dependent oxidoreductase|nr:saccharopine dehydrogenase C-terminal domain-containing protein [Polyangia bacterium]
MAKILVLGAGRVGRVIARDLCDDPGLEVTVADRDGATLAILGERHGYSTQAAELADPAKVRELAAGFDLVVGALPGFLGLETMKAVIEASRSYVDISFMPEDPRPLGKMAKDKGLVVLYDMGVAPGMSNLLLAQGVRRLAPARFARYLVGGLPMVRSLPWEYEAPFSPIDVVEEYTRPARFKSGGLMRARPALSDPELFDFPGLGTLEGFLTDGLRSLLDTVDCPHLEEKTLRYPGHADRIRVLRDSGFFGEDEIQVGKAKLKARDFTFALLDKAWRQAEGSEEFTVMRVEVEGGDPLAPTRLVWDLLDRTDKDRAETSMARTTGFPAALCARRIVNNTIPLRPGVHPPEALAEEDAFVDWLLTELSMRSVIFQNNC